jgi:hypothetical protein
MVTRSLQLEKQTSQANIKDQVSALQVEYTMHRDMGNNEAALGCLARIQHLQRELVAINNSTWVNTTASACSSMEEAPPPV